MRMTLVAILLLFGCCSSEPSLTETLKKADEAERARKEAEARARDAFPVEKKNDALALPWTIDSVKSAVKMGTVATYAISGTDAKGKPVDDEFVATIKGTDATTVKINEHRVSMRADPVSSQVKTLDFSRFSPFFFIERPEHELIREEHVEVPVGRFETKVVELRGFFGAHITAWMIIDRPGLYAKVHDHGNANHDDDKTDLVYELRSIVQD